MNNRRISPIREATLCPIEHSSDTKEHQSDEEEMYPWDFEEPLRNENEQNEDTQDIDMKCLPCQPSAREIEQHNITHWPFRAWCPACVLGRATSDPHKRKQNRKSDVQMIIIDYSYFGKPKKSAEGDNQVDDGSMPTLNMVDRTTQGIRS